MNAMLNQVAALLIANGITPTKELVISVAIKGITEMGVPVTEAAKLILGDGVINQIQTALRA